MLPKHLYEDVTPVLVPSSADRGLGESERAISLDV